jgi:hypothetical protein
MPRARVVRDYRAQYANPIRFAEGDLVTLGRHDHEWPAFVWTTTADGNAGWAPVDWLKPLGDGRAQVLCDYSAQELDVDPDDTLDVLDDYGGWYLLAHDEGTAGWVPGACLEIVDDTPPPEYTVDAIAAGWIAYWANGGHDRADAEPYGWAYVEVEWLVANDPERLWQVIRDLYPRPEAQAHFRTLAAGPLEDLLEAHGEAFIDRIESLAARDPIFAHLLGGVWQITMADAIWTRVQAAADPSGWDQRAS